MSGKLIIMLRKNQPIRLPGLKPRVCAGLILSGAFYPDLKIGVWRRRTYQLGGIYRSVWPRMAIVSI